MTLRDALYLVALRASTAASMDPSGVMYLIHAPGDTVQKAIDTFHASKAGDQVEVAIAAVNGPRMTNIAGTPEACAAVSASIKAPKVKLDIPHAYHSPLMQPLLDGMRAAMADVALSPPSSSTRFFPTVTGHAASGSDHTEAETQYWLDQCVRGVDFMPAMRRLADAGFDTFVEIGPRPTLTKMGQRCVTDIQRHSSTWLAALVEESDKDETPLEHLRCLSEVLAEKCSAGTRLDAHKSSESKIDGSHSPLELNRKRFWRPLPHRIVKEVTVSRSDGAFSFERKLGVHLGKFLQQHRVNDISVISGSLYIDCALALFAGASSLGKQPLNTQSLVAGVRLSDIVYQRPLQLPTASDLGGLTSKNGIVIQGTLAKRTVRISSRTIDTGATTPHFSCSAEKTATKPAEAVDVQSLVKGLTQLDSDAVYETASAFGVQYGPHFQRISKLWRGDGVAVAALVAPSEDSGFLLDVGLLDSAFQTCGFAVERHEAYMPFSIESISIYGRPELSATNCRSPDHFSIARLISKSDNMVEMNLTLVDAEGKVLIDVRSIKSRAAPRQDAVLKESVYEVEWARLTAPADPPTTSSQSVQGAAAIVIGAGGQSRVETILGNLARGKMGLRTEFIDSHKALTARDLESAKFVFVVPPSSGSQAGADMILEAESVVQCGLTNIQSILRVMVESGSADNLSPLCILTTGAMQATPEDAELNPAHATLWGLARSARVEYPDLNLIMIDLDNSSSSVDATAEAVQTILTCHRPSWCQGETEFAVRRGQVMVPRMVRAFAEHCRLPQQLAWRQAARSGGLSSLAWVPQPEPPRTVGSDMILLGVRAVGLNFKDVLSAAGVDVGAVDLGADCAGRVLAVGSRVTGLRVGDDVFGIAPGCFKDVVQARADRLALMPPEISYFQAATLPSAYLTARLALYDLEKPKIGSGGRVLVHAGTGAVGQAVIKLAQNNGCTVYATAGSEAKRAYLVEKLGVAGVFPSRDVGAFKCDIKEKLQGDGIDLVVNCLAGDFIPASMSCLRKGGRFVEIGRKSIWTPEQARQHRSDVVYDIIELDKLHSRPGGITSSLRELAVLVERGILEPLSSEVFARSKVLEAFRKMQRTQHIGKVILSLQDTPDTRSAYDVLLPDRVHPSAVENAMDRISSTALKNLNVPLDELERGWRELSLYCFRSLNRAARRVPLDQVTPQQRRLHSRYRDGDPTGLFQVVEESPGGELTLDAIAKTYPFLQPQVDSK